LDRHVVVSAEVEQKSSENLVCETIMSKLKSEAKAMGAYIFVGDSVLKQWVVVGVISATFSFFSSLSLLCFLLRFGCCGLLSGCVGLCHFFLSVKCN